MPYAPEYLHMVIPGVQFEAYLYGRNSDDVFKSGGSVDDQLLTGRTLCERHNWPIRREFSDTDISASRHTTKVRDDFESLIATITNHTPPPGIRRIVVAYEASRYYRDLEAYVRLRNACLTADVLLCYNGQVYDLSRRDDRKATAMHAVDAEDEAEGIRDRIVRTTTLQAEAGRPHGRLQFGYTREYQVVSGRKRCVRQYEHPVQGPYVLKALQHVDSGRSIRSLLQWLKSQPGAARSDGSQWSPRTVRTMLMNRAYLGERLHNGTYRKAAWPPIKGLETPQGRAMFNRVTAKLSEPGRRTQRGTEVRHLLTYLALCGECGDHAMLSAQSRTRGRAVLACEDARDVGMTEEVMNAFVEEAVIEWFSSKRARAALVPGDDEVEEKLTAAQRMINGYEEQLREARALAEDFDLETGRPRLSAASLASMEQKLGPRLEAERKKLADLTGVSPLLLGLLESDDPDLVWNGYPATESEPERPALTLEQRREVIRKVVTVRLHKATLPGSHRVETSRIRLSFAGEPGFRVRPLRVPESVPGRDDAAGALGAV